MKYRGSQKCYQVPTKLESKLIFTSMVFMLFFHSKNIPRFKIMCIVDRHISSQRTVNVWHRKIRTNLHLGTRIVFAEINIAQIFAIFHLFHFFSCTLVTCPIFWINDISVVFFNFDQPGFSNIFVSQNYYNCHELK